MKIFVSYARKDSEFALQLADDLKRSGADVWIDQWRIGLSERWDRAVEKALKECACILVLLSPSSVAAENVMDEVAYGLDEQKRIVPVLYKACDIPFRLRRLQSADFRTDHRLGLTQLLAFLGLAQDSTLTADTAGA